MAAASPTLAQYLAVGASHRSSALSLRGRLLVEEPALPRFLAQLQALGIAEAVVLSTPERIEVVAAAADPAAAADAIREALAGNAGLDAGELHGQLHVFQGEEAVRHLFAAAAGLDALVPGDTDVAARLRAAGELARRCGSLGAAVESLIAGSLRAAERVAAETDLAARPASIAAAAVRIARDIHGDLSRANALVIGPGDMGERLAQRLQAAGLSRVVLTGRSATRLEQAARRLQCEVVPLASLDEALAGADIVIANMGSSPPAVTEPMIKAALKRRRRKPIFLIDAAIPGDIDRAAGEQEDAFLYDLDDLEKVVMEGGAEREQAAATAAAIVAEEAARFIAETAGTEDTAETALLRRRFETARAAVLEETKGAAAAAATRLLVDRLLPQMAALVREAGRRASAVPRGDEPRSPEAARTPGKKDGTP
jgi:glutamyl-tRNA reductase